MFIKEEKVEEIHSRSSKLGNQHYYTRIKTNVIFQCDNCGEIFCRPRGNMSSKRLSNNYFHCCSKCDNKRFAQRKGVERRLIWDMPASSTLPINRF
jgi:ribosomal protein L24E